MPQHQLSARQVVTTAIGTVVTFACLSVAPLDAASYKCWTNNQGVRECGDTIPPEYIQKESKTFNERGLVVEEVDRAKSREQLLEERRIQHELDLQNEKDQVLLSTYLRAEDILAVRDRQVAIIDNTINNAKEVISQFQRKLDSEMESVQKHQAANQAIPADLQSAIDTLQQRIKSREEMIERNQQERQSIIETYDRDYQRYLEMTGSKR
ncbi:MAG: hypothetical protein HQL49_03045 [Gammaproteobacteria bacterium]|nr:hypothetical protein [Gammaproteobacteria bacterium]